MSQSKPQRRCVLWVLALFVLVTWGSIALWAPSGEPEYDSRGELVAVPGFFNDAVITYNRQIEEKMPVNDWHCPLYMYEGKWVRQAVECLTGETCSGVAVQRGFMVLADALMLVNLAYWLALMMRRDTRMGWMALPMSFFTFVAHCGLGVSLDYFFTVLLFSSISLSIILFRTEKRMVKGLLTLLLLLVLFHLVNYRRNAALMLPVIFYMVAVGWGCSAAWWKKAAVAVVLMLPFYMVSVRMVPWVLPVQKMTPMAPMVESDLRIAAVLENKQDAVRAYLHTVPFKVYAHEYKDSITAYWAGAEQDLEHWPAVWQHYLNAWKTNTGNMLMARFLQLSQFYWSGATPAPVEWLADALYPEMRSNERRWIVLESVDMKQLHLRILRLMVTLGTVWLFLRYLWLWLVRRAPLRAEQFACMFITGLASAYSISYVVVTPTSDFRYLLPAQLLGFYVMVYLLLVRLTSRQK